jgi:hypothetical protein
VVIFSFCRFNVHDNSEDRLRSGLDDRQKIRAALYAWLTTISIRRDSAYWLAFISVSEVRSASDL